VWRFRSSANRPIRSSSTASGDAGAQPRRQQTRPPGRGDHPRTVRGLQRQEAAMKVDAGVQRLLLDLADSDAEINRLEHRRKNLPEDAEIAEIGKSIDAARDDLVRAEISAEDLGREYRR